MRSISTAAAGTAVSTTAKLHREHANKATATTAATEEERRRNAKQVYYYYLFSLTHTHLLTE